MAFNAQFLHDMQRERDFLDRLWPRVSPKGEGSRDTSGPGRSDTSAFSETREARRGMTGGRCATRIVYRTHVRARGSSSSNHQLPIRRVDSWKHGSRSKISGPGIAPPPSPYMATSRAYSRLLRRESEIESEKKRGEKKGNNNNHSLPRHELITREI